MGHKFFRGTAAAVQQVDTITIGGTLSGETFEISIDGDVIASHTDSDTLIASAHAALLAAWNASTDPRAAAVTAGGTSPDLTLTAEVAGVPFVVTVNTPGGSATFVKAATTASSGPSDWSTAGNWSDGAVPVNADEVTLDTDKPILFGLAQSAVTLAGLYVTQRQLGQVGLRRNAFVTSADGETVDETVFEYRDRYLHIGADRVEIGQHLGDGDPAGASLIKIHNASTGDSSCEVYDTAANGTDNLPAVQYKASDADADLFVRRAPGGVGVATEEPGETATLGNVHVDLDDATARVTIGAGVTLTNYYQSNGDNILQAAATGTLARATGGTLRIEGDQQWTTVESRDGATVFPNNVPSGGVGVVNAHAYGGTIDWTQSSRARTATNVRWEADGAHIFDSDVLTITNLHKPTGVRNWSVV